MDNLTSLIQGPALIGIYISLVLYGINVEQFYEYAVNYRPKFVIHTLVTLFIDYSDPWFTKWLVLTLAVLETLSIVLNVTWIRLSLVEGFGNFEQLQHSTLTYSLHAVIMGVVICLTQLFFAWRIFILTRAKWAVMLISLCALVSVIGGVIGTYGQAVKWTRFADTAPMVPLSISWYCLAASGDLVITSILTCHLRKCTGINPEVDTLLHKIIRLTVQNGLVTTVWVITGLICFLFVPGGVHFVFLFPQPKLYSNTVMSSLNARSTWKYGSDVSGPRTSQLSVATIAFCHSDPIQTDVFMHMETNSLRPFDSKTERRSSDVELGQSTNQSKSSSSTISST